MVFEDLVMFWLVFMFIVFYLSDGVVIEKVVELVVNIKGICFIWISCLENVIIYSNNEDF